MGKIAQTLEEDATLLKTGVKELWYADSSFHSSAALLKPSAMQAPQNITEMSSALALVLVLLVLSFAVYLVYKRWVPKPFEEAAVAVEEMNFRPKMEEAEEEKNYRLALRYFYLQVLKLLSQQSLIKYERGKPNAAYVNEIRHHKWGEIFKELTHHYDYAWYGNYPVEASEYYRLKDKFNALHPHV